MEIVLNLKIWTKYPRYWKIRKKCTVVGVTCKKNHSFPGAFSGFLPGGGRVIFRGWPKSPRGWRKNCALPASAFDILVTCYKEIHKIYFFLLFLVRLLSFIRKFDSPQRPMFRRGWNPFKWSGGGVANPWNPQGVARGAAPCHPPEIASGVPYRSYQTGWMVHSASSA